MSEGETNPLPVVGSQIITACGSVERFLAETPHALHEGQWIFFCTPTCMREFVQDPDNSCLVGQSDTKQS
ncbi:MAG: hypothetical protein ACWGOY_02440 [Anaerolineales bacterium]